MKIKKDFYIVAVSHYYGTDKMVMSDIEMYDTREEAEKNLKAWLEADDYVTQPEFSDGTFPNRTFEVKATEGNGCGTLERVTDVPQEYYFRRAEIIRETKEIDVPLVFDVKDIKKIQLFVD